ncbi:MAG: hypothetical protein AB7P04_04135 [Bacteriovoracia bacterium]
MILIVLSAFVSAAAAQAGELCRLQLTAVIFTTDMSIYAEIPARDGKWKYEVDTWEDCYAQAVAKVADFNSHAPFVATLWNGKKEEATGYISMNWVFHDGVFWMFRSSGKLTRYTSTFEKNASTGDRRYFSDGSRF